MWKSGFAEPAPLPVPLNGTLKILISGDHAKIIRRFADEVRNSKSHSRCSGGHKKSF
jgi:hypothetical protein